MTEYGVYVVSKEDFEQQRYTNDKGVGLVFFDDQLIVLNQDGKTIYDKERIAGYGGRLMLENALSVLRPEDSASSGDNWMEDIQVAQHGATQQTDLGSVDLFSEQG